MVTTSGCFALPGTILRGRSAAMEVDPAPTAQPFTAVRNAVGQALQQHSWGVKLYAAPFARLNTPSAYPNDDLSLTVCLSKTSRSTVLFSLWAHQAAAKKHSQKLYWRNQTALLSKCK